MDPSGEDLLVGAIDELAEFSPPGLLMLLISGANELRGAIDEGRAEVELLVELRDHVQMLIASGPTHMSTPAH
jgi:hypothetical protein